MWLLGWGAGAAWLLAAADKGGKGGTASKEAQYRLAKYYAGGCVGRGRGQGGSAFREAQFRLARERLACCLF